MATIVSEHIRITPALFDVYRKAKKATSTAIKWVVSTSAIGGHNPEPNAAWSLDDLTRAANIIRARCIETPQTIACAFEIAIGARAEITAYFKQHLEDDHEATSSHEHFTDTLRLIFEDLRPSRRHIPKTTSSTPQHPHPILSPNPFQLLTSVHETEPESVDWRVYDEASSKENSQGPFSTQESAGETFCLKDDDLATHFEMYYVLTNLDLTCNRVKSYWQKAAQGSMSIWFAAWLTTAAYENAKFCFNGGPFSCSLNATDHEEFIKKYDAFLRAGLATADETPNAGSDGRVSFFLSGLRLFTPWLAVLRWKRSGYTSAELEENVHEKLEHLITVLMGSRSDPGHIVNTVVEFAVMRLLLKSVFRMFLRSRRSSVQFNSMSCPLVFDLHEFLYAEGNSVKTNIVFGLKLLVESYKSFILDEGGLKLPNCRIQILKFGRDVRGSLRRVRDMRPLRERGSDPCSCLDCTGDSLIHSLDDFDKNLECIVNDKRFDLYSQAPWVAGTQIVHIATEATKLGMRLGNRGQYVGSVLQLYNFLLQLRVVDEETVLLEKLCNILESTVFHGSRPKSNFFSQYALFSGGRLEFDRSKKRTHEPKDGYQSSHPNTRWRIGMTKSSTKALNYHSTSILAALWSCSFRFSCYSWAYVWYGTDKSKNASQKELESATTAVAVHPFVCALDHLESRVGPECIGDFPQAKINWLEVYITCTEILANISRAAENDLDHPCPGAPDNDERWTEDGEWFVQQFLQMSEKYSGDISKSDFASKHNRLVESATKGIRRAMKGKTKANYLWDM